MRGQRDTVHYVMKERQICLTMFLKTKKISRIIESKVLRT
jgi:hypothetical protein